jgi:hypothetical protein
VSEVGLWFYWELDPAGRAAAEPYLIEEEGYLANDINWGRRLVNDQHRLESCPDLYVTMPAPSPDDLTVYGDPIAAILQAAVYVGLDPEEVCERALFTQRGVLNHATASAQSRHERQTGGSGGASDA